MDRIENISSFRKNDENLSTSGQPTEAELSLLASDNYKWIINLRPNLEMETVFDEKAIVENLGLEYLQIPMTFETLNNKILMKFFEVMEETETKKSLVHCHHNIRVSALLAFYRILKQNWSKEEVFNDLSKMMEITPTFENYFSHHISEFKKSG